MIDIRLTINHVRLLYINTICVVINCDTFETLQFIKTMEFSDFYYTMLAEMSVRFPKILMPKFHFISYGPVHNAIAILNILQTQPYKELMI